MKVAAFRQLARDWPKIDRAIGEGAIGAFRNVDPHERDPGTACSLAKNVYGRTVWPAVSVDELPRRRLLKANAIGPCGRARNHEPEREHTSTEEDDRRNEEHPPAYPPADAFDPR